MWNRSRKHKSLLFAGKMIIVLRHKENKMSSPYIGELILFMTDLTAGGIRWQSCCKIHEIFWKNDHNCLFFCCFLYILFCFFYIFSPVSGRCCLCDRYFIHEILSPFQSLEYHISGFFCTVINFL